MPRVSALLIALLCTLPLGASAQSVSSLARQAREAAESGDELALGRALRALASQDDDDVADELLELCVEVPAAYGAALARLRGQLKPAALERLCERAAERRGDWKERLVAVEACGLRREAESGRALAAALESRKVAVQRVAVRGVHRRRLVPAVSALIELYTELHEDGASVLLRETEDALRAITGESFTSPVEWRSFWEAKGGKDFVRPRGKGKARSDTQTRPSFFGSEILSDRVLFVLDVSGSMRYGNRLGRVKEQLRQLLAQLPEDSKFALLCYSGAFKLPGPLPEDRLLPPVIEGTRWLGATGTRLERASERQKAKALEWVEALQPKGKTFTSEALAHAFEIKDVDLIVLLSDGQPDEFAHETLQPLGPRGSLERILRLNRFERLRINTIGLGGGGDTFLEVLAKATGGTFVSVPD